MRDRRVTLSLSTVLILILAALVLLAAKQWRHPDSQRADELAMAGEPPAVTGDLQATVVTSSPVRTTSDRVRRGDALATVLGRQVDDRDQVNALVAGFSRELDLRRVPAGAELEFAWADDNRLLRIDYRDPREDGFLRLQPDPSGYRLEHVVLPADTVLQWFRGEVRSSVYESILEQGGSPMLAIKFFEIFQFTHYFAMDTRVGDRYAFLVESIRRDGATIGYGRVFAARYAGQFDTLTAVWRPDGDGGEYFGEDGLSFRRDLLRVPFPAARITSTYGVRRHPVTGRVRKHHGVDLAADRGTPVVSAGRGVVTKVGRNHPGYGNWVHVKHGGTGFETRYGHFQSIARGIRVGSRVEQGTVIGYVGSTGMATGPHLHYEVFRDGSRLNPLRVKGSPVQKLSEFDHLAFFTGDYLPWAYLLDIGEETDSLRWARLEPPVATPWPTLLAGALFGAGSSLVGG